MVILWLPYEYKKQATFSSGLISFRRGICSLHNENTLGQCVWNAQHDWVSEEGEMLSFREKVRLANGSNIGMESSSILL